MNFPTLNRLLANKIPRLLLVVLAVGSQGDSGLQAQRAVEVWVRRFNGQTSGNDTAKSLAIGREGNVYVAGGSAKSDGFLECVTIAYSSSGLPLWTNWFGVTSNAHGDGIATDGVSGNVYVIATPDRAIP